MRSCLVFGVSLCVGCLGKPGKRRPEGARLVGVSKGPKTVMFHCPF